MNFKVFAFNPFQENTYIIWDGEGQCAIIDPGCYDPDEKEELGAFITNEKLTPVKLLNTHCHVDHVLGNRFVAERYGLGLEMHRDDVPVLEAVPRYAMNYGFDTGEMVRPTTFLNDGETVKVGKLEIEILHVPGHSPGSVCFYHRASAHVIAGDALFQGSIGRTDLPGGDHAQLIQAIKSKLLTLPDGVSVHPGHGPSTTIGFEKRHNPFLQ
ncbi:MAG: MBL fold metallo-hydrolase [Flavobacteriales bacterium]|nr:MBL fold metallo-hydrolase [Flavobacteriales bacterium]